MSGPLKNLLDAFIELLGFFPPRMMIIKTKRPGDLLVISFSNSSLPRSLGIFREEIQFHFSSTHFITEISQILNFARNETFSNE